MSLTISSVAAALGISKGTVSRAITGNGRISSVTQKRIRDYMAEHDFHPNAIAQNLSTRKSMTLAYTVPSDRRLIQLPFYLQCLSSVIGVALTHRYDVLAVDNTYATVSRAIAQGKVDGVIVSRNPEDPRMLDHLVERDFPFVVIGPTGHDDVITIDHDHTAACREFTAAVLGRWEGRPGMVAGPKNDLISLARAAGFSASAPGAPIAWGAVDEATALTALEELLAAQVDIVFCGDDMICGFLDAILRSGRLDTDPTVVRLASFHGSPILQALNPTIPVISFDSASLGSAACTTLLDRIAGLAATSVTLGYDIVVGT